MSDKDVETIQASFEQDRRDYWLRREQLLASSRGKWVAVHKGRVVAVGNDPLSSMDAALAEDGYAYANKVGEEDRVMIRQRRVPFPDDAIDAPTPTSRMTTVFSNFTRILSATDTDVIPDMGADVTGLPVEDCQAWASRSGDL